MSNTNSSVWRKLAWGIAPFVLVIMLFVWYSVGDKNATSAFSLDENVTSAGAVDVLPADLGMRLYRKHGCNACHTLTGRVSSKGPSWKGLYGSERMFVSGRQAIADENYLRTSIIDARKEIVVGYNRRMPSYRYLSDTEVNALVAYIKTL